MVSVPDRFESKISTIEESCDLTTLSIAELINKLQAQEQRDAIHNEEHAEGAFNAKFKGKKPVTREKNEHQGGENFLLAVSAKRPIMLRKIVGPKTSKSTIVIIVIRMVILKSFVVPSKTNHPNSPHNKQIV